MNKTPLIRASVVSFILLTFTIIIGIVVGEPVSDISHDAVAAESETQAKEADTAKTEAIPVSEEIVALANYLGDCNLDILEEVSNNCIVINKEWFSDGTDMHFTPSYVDRTVTCEFSGTLKKATEGVNPLVIRLYDKQAFTAEPMKLEEFEKLRKAQEEAEKSKNYKKSGEYEDTFQNTIDLNFDTEDPVICEEIVEEDNSTKIALTMRTTTEYEMYEDDHYFYVRCVDPHELYDKIVVIDAGHGGKDPGSVSADNKHYEKDINLNILLYLKELLDSDGRIKAYYTRTEDKKLSLFPRVRLANDLKADMFISVHCNSAKSTSVGGTEVLYNQYYSGEEGFTSKHLAKLCSDNVNENYPLMNRGIVPRGDDVLILSECEEPSALIEVAYLSNSSNLKSIVTEESQRAVAEGIYDAIRQAYKEIGK